MKPLVLRITWLTTDLLLFVGSYALAYFFRVGFVLSSQFPFDKFFISACIAAPLWLVVLATTRAFAITERQKTVRAFFYIAWSGLTGIAFQTLTYYFLFNAFYSRLLLIEAFVFQVILTAMWHIVMEEILRRILWKNPAYPLLLVGLTRESRRLLKILNQERCPLKPVAILDGTGTSEKEVEGVPVLGKLDKLESTITKLGITHVLQASDSEQSLNLLSACRSLGVTYMLLPSVIGIVERDERMGSIEGFAVTMVDSKRTFFGKIFS